MECLRAKQDNAAMRSRPAGHGDTRRQWEETRQVLHQLSRTRKATAERKKPARISVRA